MNDLVTCASLREQQAIPWRFSQSASNALGTNEEKRLIMELESDGISAEALIAKLEAKLQAALDVRGLRRCQDCRNGILKRDIRDIVISRQPRSATVRGIHGLFCNQCGAIELDENTDSARRYATACDALEFKNRAAEKWRSLNPKHGRPSDGVAYTLWHAMRETWSGYFAPLHMAAWFFTISFSWSRAKYRVHGVNESLHTVKAIWDSDAGVWVAWSADVPGLSTEARTMSELSSKLKNMVPELQAANGLPLRDISLAVLATPFDDQYPTDDGALSEQQIAALRADVEKHFPRGKLISRKELFQ